MIIDSGNIASDLRFNTHNLPRDVKRLEQLFEKDKKVDLNTISLLNNLDKSTFGQPIGKSPAKNTNVRRSQSTLKPLGNKLFQAGTNIASFKQYQ